MRVDSCKEVFVLWGRASLVTQANSNTELILYSFVQYTRDFAGTLTCRNKVLFS
jgi:hypothetical protein